MEQAIQVSPTEDDAVNLSKMFARAAEAIVQASSLPGIIESLKAQVTELQGKLDAAQLHSQELDRSLGEARTERDQARQELAQARQAHGDHVASLNTEINSAHNTIDQQTGVIESRNREIDSVTRARDEARRERDEHGMRALELEDQLKAAQDKLDAIQEHFTKVFHNAPVKEGPAPSWGEVKAAVAQPSPEPSPQPESPQPEANPVNPVEPAPADQPGNWWEAQRA